MIVGIQCMEDGEYKPFQTCIDRHECYEAKCPALTFAIKLQRDNMKERKDAGISASTLTSCPREFALLQLYDYYEDVADGWVKSMGTIVHSMIESDPDPPEHVFRERRIERYIDLDGRSIRLTGKPDEVSVKYKTLVDYKTKERLPTKADPSHELQFNVYCWLLSDGMFLDTGEPVNVQIEKGGMVYVTRKSTNPFKKIGYPVWDQTVIEEKIRQRLRPVVDFLETGKVPDCDPYQTFGGNWICGCKKIEKQLEKRGIELAHG